MAREAYITVQAASLRLGVSPQRVHQLLGAGQLVPFGTGRYRYVGAASVEARIELLRARVDKSQLKLDLQWGRVKRAK